MRAIHDPIDTTDSASYGAENGTDRAPLTCVILAAGPGTRMGANVESKPLVSVAALALLDHDDETRRARDDLPARHPTASISSYTLNNTAYGIVTLSALT